MINDGYKTCSTCLLLKNLSEFYKKLDNTASKCKACTSISNKEYRLLHKDKLYEYRKNYYLEHKDELILYGKNYRAILENKIKTSKYKKEYFEKNKKTILIKSNEHRKIRRKIDIPYRLRALISKSVHRMLTNSKSSKRGGSIKNNLPYTIQELKDHLESKFEFWMTWDNQGKYNPKTWNDNDSSTWTWQLDHVIPQSTLPYTSMEDENFKKCWALDNLRPYSSKQNLLEGSSKIRHIMYNEMDS